MNRFARTFTAVALALGTLPSPALVHAATDNPPTTPATLTANRYSATGADVIWSRSSDDRGAVRGYEVFRDGVSLGIRDALSVSEKNLIAGRSYTYSVAAVDSAGQRSAPIRVTLNTKGFSNAASAPAPRPAAPSTAAPVPAPATGTLPAPTGLRASAYSTSSGEVFWTRPTTPGLRYEVRRDGALVKTIDGVSYYDNALSAGRDFRYDIVAIDRGGKRSAPASVTLRAKGTAAAANPFAPTATTAPTTPGTPAAPSGPSAPAAPTATALAAPSGLRAAAYSTSAAELFWTRPTTPALRYEVRRDGALVKTTDGVSYYDGALVSGRDHRYEVVAIDGAGRRSAPASVSLQGRGGGTSAPATPVAADAKLNAANADTVLAEVLGRMTGNGYASFSGGFGDRLRLDLDSYRQYDTVTRGDIVCTYGGGVKYELGFYDTSLFDKLTFDRCAEFLSDISGYVETSIVSSRGGDQTTTGRKLVLDQHKSLIKLDGTISKGADSVGLGSFSTTGNLTFPNGGEGVFTIANASISGACGEGSIPRESEGTSYFGRIHRAEGTFELSSSKLPLDGVSVRTSVPFSYEYVDGVDPARPAPYTFEKGRMTVTAKDGSRLDVDTATGDPATYRLTVTAGGKSASSLRAIEPLMKVARNADYCV